ncbi:hypothetical protein JXA40_00430 [bacterium]|nr:hypothetical protein [candidate division CSSED10-310 bacterium]
MALMFDESTRGEVGFPVNWIPVGRDAQEGTSSLSMDYWRLSDKTGYVNVDVAPSIECAGMDWLDNGGIGIQIAPGVSDLVRIRHSLAPYVDSLHDIFDGAKLNAVHSFLGKTFPSGITPAIVQESMNKGAVTIAVLSVPYKAEGRKNLEQSRYALSEIRHIADATCIIPLDRLTEYLSGSVTLSMMKKTVHNVFNRCVRGILDLACYPGFYAPDSDEIVDFFKSAENVLFGYTNLIGNRERSIDAIRFALNHPMDPIRKFGEAEQILVSICEGTPNIDSDFYLSIKDICQNFLGAGIDIIVGSFESNLPKEEPWMAIYGRGIGEKRNDGFDFPEFRLDPEKAPPKLPAYYRKHYGQLTEKYH